jgi:hypothetical protein
MCMSIRQTHRHRQTLTDTDTFKRFHPLYWAKAKAETLNPNFSTLNQTLNPQSLPHLVPSSLVWQQRAH